MRTANLEYTVDGREMVGYLAVDDQQHGRRPAVLVAHGGLGLDDHAKGRAERLATLGYVAFALDYHGGGRTLPNQEAFARLRGLMGDSSEPGRWAKPASTSCSLRSTPTRPGSPPSATASAGRWRWSWPGRRAAAGGGRVPFGIGDHATRRRPPNQRQHPGLPRRRRSPRPCGAAPWVRG